MKKIFISILCVLLAACKADQGMNTPYLKVFRSKAIAESPYQYIILRQNWSHATTYETFHPEMASSTIGEWELKKDTLVLTPRYYIEHINSIQVAVIDSIRPHEDTVTRKLIIKKDTLVDVTDYHKLLSNDVPYYYSPMYYVRVK